MDELHLWAFSWRVASAPWSELLARVAADTQGPAHFVLLKVWMALCGDSPLALRGLSALLTALAVPLVFAAVRQALRGDEARAAPEALAGDEPARREPGPPTRSTAATAGALLAAAMLVVSVPQLEAALTPRCYSLGVFAAMLSAWTLLKALHARGRPVLWWTAYGAAVALFCYTHYFAFFTLLAQAIYVAGEIALRWRESRPNAAATARGFLLAMLVALALYSPWLPFFLAQARMVRAGFWIKRPPWDEVRRVFFTWSTGVAHQHRGLACLWAVILTALVLHSVWRCGRAGWFFLLQAAVPWMGSLALSFFGDRPIFVDRYLVFGHAALVCLWGVNIARLPGWPERGLAAALVVGTALVGAWGFAERPVQSPQAVVRAVAHLREQYRAGDLVLADSPQDVNVLRYYAKQQGIEPIDVRCRLSPFREPGWAGHATSLSVDDVLPPDASVPAGVQRVWRAASYDAHLGDVPAGFRLVRAETFSGGGWGRYALTLYDRQPH